MKFILFKLVVIYNTPLENLCILLVFFCLWYCSFTTEYHYGLIYLCSQVSSRKVPGSPMYPYSFKTLGNIIIGQPQFVKLQQVSHIFVSYGLVLINTMSLHVIAKHGSTVNTKITFFLVLLI